MSNSGNINNHTNGDNSGPRPQPSYIFPTTKSKYIIESESTDSQVATEIECTPFFVDLQTLSKGQLDHLRNTGLLPPLPTTDVEGTDGNGGNVKGKAAKLLGVENDDEDNDGNNLGRPKIELLDDYEDQSSSIQNDGLSNGKNCNSSSSFDPYAIRLLRSAHTSYLTNALTNKLPRGFVSLDSSHPWMVYWCLHSLDLLGYFDISNDQKNSDHQKDNNSDDVLREVEVMQKSDLLKRIVSTIQHCWTDVTLEFTTEEVINDIRLKNQCNDHLNSSANNGDKKISIIGGGFGGGPQQMPHVAPTYAAVLSLCIVASLGLEQSSNHPYHEAGQMAINVLKKRRLQLYAFFLTLREPHDEQRIAFRMQHDGEIDVRASYCILAPCYLLGLLDNDSNNGSDDKNCNPLLSNSISKYIASCQTFEGGFGAEPYNEAHGGYTFCALAALRILNSVPLIDVDALSSWLARRQMGYEGGFCGRTNKLVDGCYSFWQGGAVAVLDGWYNDNNKETVCDSDDKLGREPSFDEVMLQRYILLCAQDVNGGLRDKPSKPKDFYHSCYNLSGLSVAQHALKEHSWPPTLSSLSADDGEVNNLYNRLFGDANVNIVGRTDPVINIREERVKFMMSQHF